ncbi:hypothetical protein E4L96_04235 [Massilia arenosa]|uniref:DUF4384 domain-containing protein n=1 Tax=Zemynaea arenosa TaxID=2561931 RepID=A0A4Y9SJT0_9BURK|nr:hypothetical protein [Massilia arenosa]TFW26592.1 hypothetical protein E4L96_04235 [Massilia arenosa]
MSLKRAAAQLVLASAALLSLAAHAQSFTAGTYMLQGGSYTIQIERQSDSELVVVEPNKRSVYARKSPGVYTFYNPNTSTLYGIRVIDATTVEAFKPERPDAAPSRLVLMSSGSTGGASAADTDKYEKLAEKYSALIESDPANVQSWVACSGVALKRANSTKAEADAYATQMASMLKQMDAASSPCPEVIAF